MAPIAIESLRPAAGPGDNQGQYKDQQAGPKQYRKELEERGGERFEKAKVWE